MKLTKITFLFSLTALLVCMCMSTVAVNADTLGDYAVETTTSADSLENTQVERFLWQMQRHLFRTMYH